MKKLVALFLAAVSAVFLLVLVPACAEAPEDVFPVKISISSKEDGKSAGTIEQSVITLEEGREVRIDMSDVFDMYPEHSGIYGVMYSAGDVRIAAGGKEKTGKGFLEFSFPGAAECTVSGSGTVYAYFLPVPCLRLSTGVSLKEQAFDTSYVTTTAVGHGNMFILTDPHTYIWQNNGPPAGSVYVTATPVGPIPSQYDRFDEHDPRMYSFLYNTPVLHQCNCLTTARYQEQTYYARPLQKLVSAEGYEIWAYKELQTEGTAIDNMDALFAECIKVANEQILAPGLKVDKIMVVLLGEELGAEGMDGRAITDEMFSEIGHINGIFINGSSFSDSFDNRDYFVLAHEIGHIVQYASLAYNMTGYSIWFHEGFATYFGEKVCRRLGKPYTDTCPLNEHDSAEVNKFHTNMIFGIDDHVAYNKRKDTLVNPQDKYSFGSIFFRYLEARYGEGFFKRISQSFYDNFYKGHESQFFYRRNDIDNAADTYFALVRKNFDKDVYTAYPAYLYNNMPDMVVKDAIDPVHEDVPDPDYVLPGDVNGDEVVDGLDVIRLMKYLSGEVDPETFVVKYVEIWKENADVNADGVVDELDLLRLVRYLGGEDVTLERGFRVI